MAYEVDLLLRGASLGLSVLIAILMHRLPERTFRWLGWGLLASVTAYVIQGGALSASWPESARTALQLLAVTGPYFVWAASRFLFEDRFEFRPWHACAVGFMMACVLARHLLPDGGPPLRLALRAGVDLPTIALGLSLLWRIGRDWPADLVDSRRRFRLVFLTAGGLLPLLAMGSRALDIGGSALAAKAALMSVFIAAKMAIVILMIEMQRESNAVAAPAKTSPSRKPWQRLQLQAQSSPGASNPSESTPASYWASRLIEVMQSQRWYRETGLSIGALAEKMALPEHRLRTLINEHLGYRNFNDFLNYWRLKEAMVRLRNPAEDRLTMLSLALDLGYGSIGPFNRAFKAALGMTPTEFRRQPAPQPDSSNPHADDGPRISSSYGHLQQNPGAADARRRTADLSALP